MQESVSSGPLSIPCPPSAPARGSSWSVLFASQPSSPVTEPLLLSTTGCSALISGHFFLWNVYLWLTLCIPGSSLSRPVRPEGSRRAEPSQAEPSQAEPSQAKLEQTT
ncbi:hypothetical protein EYF80_057230 [Liparis tanakae]|uniref:Uncharacterized protein n=1 Tax=Liparis tanakae TaxID=230148 RepID=A0A4Z2EUS7_9TELE|nr:hypothetical protein EYF80_057230 [Liparis tanakae]